MAEIKPTEFGINLAKAVKKYNEDISGISSITALSNAIRKPNLEEILPYFSTEKGVLVYVGPKNTTYILDPKEREELIRLIQKRNFKQKIYYYFKNLFYRFL
jgi:hypothetical protein